MANGVKNGKNGKVLFTVSTNGLALAIWRRPNKKWKE